MNYYQNFKEIELYRIENINDIKKLVCKAKEISDDIKLEELRNFNKYGLPEKNFTKAYQLVMDIVEESLDLEMDERIDVTNAVANILSMIKAISQIDEATFLMNKSDILLDFLTLFQHYERNSQLLILLEC